MTPSSKLKPLIWLSVAIFLTYVSCSKRNESPISTGNSTGTQTNQKLQPFSAQIIFIQPDQAFVSWSASKDSLNDTIRYKVLLAGKIVDSNLTRLNDTLKNISPGLSYQGSVVAYNPYNDTLSAPFKLVLSSTAYAYFYTSNFPTYTIQCQNLFTNQAVWTYTEPNGYPFVGTPVVVNDTLYANDNNNDVLALNASTGKVIWQSSPLFAIQNMTGPYQADGGPIYSNGKLYLNTSSAITCLNSSTGQILWSNGGTDDYYTTPVVDGGKVFEGTYTYYYTGIPDTFAYKAIDANSGATIWKQPIAAQSSYYPIASDGVLVYDDENSNYNALDESSGMQLWTKVMYNYSLDPIHYNNLVIGWGAYSLWGLNLSTGDSVWQIGFQFGGNSDPTISQDTVFATQTLPSTFEGESFQLLAVRAETGEVLWETTITQSLSSLLYVAAGRIYMFNGQSMDVYSTKDGSFIQNVSAGPGVIVVNGISYYAPQSGMMQ
jgi:outer membrane protein assembly factor BamB